MLFAGAIGRLGCSDLVVVCDAGLPIPPGPTVGDLAFRFGVPDLVEDAVAPKEVEEQNPSSPEPLESRLPDLTLIPHEELKRMVAGATLVALTGEATPYSNVIARCGVPFQG